MKIVMQDIFLMYIQSIQKNYAILVKTDHFYQKENIRKCRKTCLQYRRQKKYVIHIRALKQALNNGLKLKKVHRVIRFMQKAWLKSYIDMNTKLREEAKSNLKKISLS